MLCQMLPRVLLIDDHELVLDALEMLLRKQSGIGPIDRAADIDQASAAIREHAPDLIVMDVRLSDESGLDSIPELKRLAPEAKLIVLSMYADESYVWRALQLGADGYVLKQSSSRELIESFESVQRGERFIGSGLSLEKLSNLEQRSQPLSTDPLDRLTQREREVARLVAKGLTSDEIAKKLGIGRRTVESHRANLGHKLGVNNNVDLVRLMLRRESWKGG
jgi:DNA-binding NarL/FixJ family response regulator